MDYAAISQFALSWGLAGMTAVFVLAMLWVFRPGSRQIHQDAAEVIFRHDKKPAADDPPRALRASDPAAAVKGA